MLLFHRATLTASLSAAFTALGLLGGCANNDAVAPGVAKSMESKHAGNDIPTVGRDEVAKIVATWEERPRLGANEMIAKYGQPQEATLQQLIWHNPGPFKRITVFNLETPHDFPLPHVDFLEHTITYDVPQDKVADLIAFDASSTINRTAGELSARCDLEGHNVLTLNLDHDIVTGKKNVEEARKAFGDNVGEDVMAKKPPYVEALQFQPAKPPAGEFSDKPVIPGSPVRANDMADAGNAKAEAGGDSEVLASIIAIDMNEVLAAAEAGKKKMSQPAMDYAKMLHEMHGANMLKTMKVGQDVGVTPVITPAIEKVQKMGANDLGAMVPMDGKAFERAYIAGMVKGHTEALKMIDSQMMKMAKNGTVKLHLTAVRAMIANHLDKAKAMEAGMRP